MSHRPPTVKLPQSPDEIDGRTVMFKPLRDGIDSEVPGVLQVIVDDVPDSTHLVKILLEKTGKYVVLEENDADQAHQSARNFRPDAILMDIMMPKTDGSEVAAQIEADPELRSTPIIFLTALVTENETKDSLRIEGNRS